jgi:hypothetical protein
MIFFYSLFFALGILFVAAVTLYMLWCVNDWVGRNDD